MKQFIILIIAAGAILSYLLPLDNIFAAVGNHTNVQIQQQAKIFGQNQPGTNPGQQQQQSNSQFGAFQQPNHGHGNGCSAKGKGNAYGCTVHGGTFQ